MSMVNEIGGSKEINMNRLFLSLGLWFLNFGRYISDRVEIKSSLFPIGVILESDRIAVFFPEVLEGQSQFLDVLSGSHDF